MPRKSLEGLLPDSEFRRSYLKSLVHFIKLTYNVGPSEARKLASFLVSFMKEATSAGRDIDFDCIKLTLAESHPKKVTLNLPGLKRTVETKASYKYKVKTKAKWVKR